MYCRNDKVEDVCYILVLHLRRKGVHVSPLDSAPLALEEFVAKAKVPKGLKWFAFCLLPPKAIRSSKPTRNSFKFTSVNLKKEGTHSLGIQLCVPGS